MLSSIQKDRPHRSHSTSLNASAAFQKKIKWKNFIMAVADGSTICKSCGFEMKAKTVDIVFKSFCPGWMKTPERLQSCWGSKLCHVWHSPHSISSSLLSLSRGLSLPTSFHCSFSWRWSWKVSETCLRHILSLYLIYDLTASKHQSYLNCHRHKRDNLQKKTFVTTKSRSSNNRYLFHPVWAICKRPQSRINDKYLSYYIAIFKVPHLPWCHTRHLPQSNPVELPFHQFVALTFE